MSIPEGKARRSITMPDDAWAILDAGMAESRQSLSQVMTQYITTRPAALRVSLEGMERQLTEQANAIRELSAQVQRLTGLMETWMLREDTAPPAKPLWWH